MLAISLLLVLAPAALAQDDDAEKKLPEVGDEATDFTLHVLGDRRGDGLGDDGLGDDGDEPVEANLYKQLEEGPVVLLVLRGYPGYQCPVCSRQMSQFLREAKKFEEAGATVWMVYPGPGEALERFATEFVASRELPDGFKMLLDPDYEFTNAWNLRWDAPRETAYPSTFVIGKDKAITFAKISMSHRGRSEPEEVLEAVPAESGS
jgi:peroxiredoxin